MSAASIVKVVAAVAKAAVSVDDSDGKVRAYVFGIPVFDTRWEGVRRRRTRREERRAKR